MQVIATNLPTFSIPFNMAFAPDGRRLAVLNPSHGVVVLEPPAEEPIARLPTKTDLRGIGFTADGRVAFAQPDGVRLYDPERREIVGTLSTGGHCSCVTVSADGRTIWAAGWVEGGVTSLHRWDAATGQPLGAFGEQRGGIKELAVSANGEVVAGILADKLRVWHLRGDQLPKRAAFVGKVARLESLQRLAVTSDGSRVAASPFVASRMAGPDVPRCPVYVWDARTGKRRLRLETAGDLVGGVGLHPSRPMLAAARNAGTVVFWDSVTGAELCQFQSPVGSCYAFAFAPDGRRCAAAASGAVVVWEVP